MGQSGAVGSVDQIQREEERALLEAAGAVRRSLDLIEVTGEQALSFLDGQLSQALTVMETGNSALSFVLHPQGKVVGLVRVTVIAPDRVLLDTDAGSGAEILERLERFKLRVKAELRCREVEVVSVRGPAAPDAPTGPPLVIPSAWEALPGWDAFEGAQATAGGDLPDGVTWCSAAAWEAVRIRAGLPRNGLELTEKTIPAESGLVPVAASLTKGCYVGQELVARIDSRGHVNRLLRRIEVDGDEVPPVGSEILSPAAEAADGSVSGSGSGSEKAVGTITSSAFSAFAARPVALGYVRREIDAGETVILRWSGEAPGTAPARVLA